MDRILASASVSISDLKKNPSRVINEAEGCGDRRKDYQERAKQPDPKTIVLPHGEDDEWCGEEELHVVGKVP